MLFSWLWFVVDAPEIALGYEQPGAVISVDAGSVHGFINHLVEVEPVMGADHLLPLTIKSHLPRIGKA